MKNLAKAVISVMKEVKGIEKNTQVGSGNFGYKGVSDKDVKKIIGGAMAKHGLSILPIDVDAKTTIERWSETYNGNEKQKQLVFSEVTTKYLLLHESGESQEVCGYGHGTDQMDKGAGKATTYALKYVLLYLFLTPTGDIDDADNTHSEDVKTPQKTPAPVSPAPIRAANGEVIGKPSAKKQLVKMDADNNLTKAWLNIVEGISKGTIKTLSDVKKHYNTTPVLEAEILKTIKLTSKKAA